MVKHKVSDLEGALLDAAVAKAEGMAWGVLDKKNAWDGIARPTCAVYVKAESGESVLYAPSRSYEGVKIVDREKIELIPQWAIFEWAPDAHWQAVFWTEPSAKAGIQAYGPTPLIAAMRAYVASKLGDEIDL